MAVVAIALAAIGLGLVFQAGRFERTPSYGDLLGVLPAHVWGAIHLVVVAVVAASLVRPRVRWLVIAAHTLALALVLSWLAAFIIRYATDDATTVVNVVSWGVLLYKVIKSTAVLDEWDGLMGGGRQ